MLDAKIHRRRIRIIIGVIIAIGALVIARLFSLQVINTSLYKDRAEHQYVTPSADSFDRGNIYFSNKDGTTVAAATVANGFKIAITPTSSPIPSTPLILSTQSFLSIVRNFLIKPKRKKTRMKKSPTVFPKRMRQLLLHTNCRE